MWRTGGVLIVCLLAALLLPVLASAATTGGPPRPQGTTQIRVDSGTSVTVWERTTSTNQYTFPVTTLTGPGGTIDTLAFEHYTLTSDGVTLTIHCFRPAFGNGTGTGNNIAGVRLDGVPGFPGGLWATIIVSYILGFGGIELSRFEALGPDLSTITFMGDQDSELVLGFSADVQEFTITVDTIPAGLQVSVDGVTVTAPHPFPCWNGTTHAIAAPSPQVAGDIRYVFSNWSDGGAPSHDISCTASSNYTAMFTTQYAVVVQTLPVGLRVVVDGTPHDDQYTGWWNASEAHTIDAPSPQSTGPDARWAWTSWSDGGVRSHRVSVTEPRTFIAPFSREFRVTVTTSPSGMRVSVDGAEFVAPQTFWWGSGTTHTLSAPEAQDHEGMPLRIGSWSDGGATEHTVTIVRPGSYVAKYGVAPLPVVMNWKPIVAAAFATVLLLVGIARSWGRPYAFREPRHRGLKTFLLFSLPIVVAEAATGVASLAFGVLAIPPLVGWGTAVDIGILAAGLVVVLARSNVPSSSAHAPAPSEAAGR